MRNREDIILRLKKSGLTGRGGACFPTWKKWQAVKNAPGDKKYVVINGSEGEPGVKKDGYLIAEHPERIIDGTVIAMEYLGAVEAIFYLNPGYYKKYADILAPFLKERPILLVKKPEWAGYIGGEETAVLNALEKKRIEPRRRPPFPTESGLWGCPTLVGNAETFYAVSRIAAGEYSGERFYTIGGDCLWTGVYEYPEAWTIERLLKETMNYPAVEFFVQVGGDASGEVLNFDQLDRPAGGSGLITVYAKTKHEPLGLMRRWSNFFAAQSCGQCTPCREGTKRLQEIMALHEPNWEIVAEILAALGDTSFCALGCAVPIPLRTYVRNVLSRDPENLIKLPAEAKESICRCFNQQNLRA